MAIKFIHPAYIFTALQKPEYSTGQHVNIFGVSSLIAIARPASANAVIFSRLSVVFPWYNMVNDLGASTTINASCLIPFKYLSDYVWGKAFIRILITFHIAIIAYCNYKHNYCGRGEHNGNLPNGSSQ